MKTKRELAGCKQKHKKVNKMKRFLVFTPMVYDANIGSSGGWMDLDSQHDNLEDAKNQAISELERTEGYYSPHVVDTKKGAIVFKFENGRWHTRLKEDLWQTTYNTEYAKTDENIVGMQARLDALLKALNQRVEVEQYLWDVFHGKKPLPDKCTCRQLAVKLGVPEEYQGDNDGTKAI